jgi:myo-inositol-1(or 4)-monophosphatase
LSLNLQEIHNVALSAAEAGRAILIDYFGRLSNVREKDLAGLVSEADIHTEEKIEAVLSEAARDQRSPNVSVLGEESSYKNQRDSMGITPGSRWILDPLDGTTNYVHQFMVYGISLALEWQGELVYGLVDMPALKKTYFALKGEGAFCQDYGDEVRRTLRVSGRSDLSQALVVTGFANSNKAVLQKQIEAFAKIVTRVRGVRRTGSAAFDLCLVAEGVFDAYWETGLQAWDVAAGALLVSEAGGAVVDPSGKKFDLYSGGILATNGLVDREILEQL